MDTAPSPAFIGAVMGEVAAAGEEELVEMGGGWEARGGMAGGMAGSEEDECTARICSETSAFIFAIKPVKQEEPNRIRLFSRPGLTDPYQAEAGACCSRHTAPS